MELFRLLGTIAINSNDANKAIDETTGKASGSESKISSAFKKIGAAAATYFSTKAIIDFGKSCVDITASFEDAMLKVQSLSGATSEEYKKLSDAALQYGSTTAWTAKDVADAMGYMALAGFQTNDILASTSGMLSLASASGEELSTVTDILTDSMTGFGDSAEDAGRYADVLATVQAKTNTTVGLLGEAFKYVSPLAGAYGYKLEDVSTALGMMANAGVKGSMSGTSLSSIITRLGTNTDGCRDAIEELGVAFYNEDGSARNLSDVLTDLCDVTKDMAVAEKSATAKHIAGMEAQKGLLAILNQGSEAYKNLNKQIRDVGESTKSEAQAMADNMESGMGGAIRSVQSAWEGFKIKIGQKIQIKAEPVIRKFADIISNNVIPAVDTIADRIGNFASSASEFLKPAFDAVNTALIPIIDAFKNLGSAISEQAEETTIFSDAWNLLQEGIKFAWENIGKPVFNGIALAINLLASNWKEITSAISELWRVMVDYWQTAWNSIGVPVFNAIKYAIQLVREAFSKYMPEIQEFFKKAVADIKDSWEKHLKPALTAIGNFLNKVLKPVFESVFKGYIVPLIEYTFGFIKKTWESVLKPVFNGICDFLTGVFTLNWKKAWDGILSILKGIVNGIISGIELMANGAIESINKLLATISGVASAVGGLIGLDPVSISIEYLKLPRLAKGGVLEKGQIGFLEGDGAEAVVPLENNQRWISAVAAEMNNQVIGKDNESLDELVMLMKQLLEYLPELANKAITLDSKTLIGKLAPGMNQELGRLQIRGERYV